VGSTTLTGAELAGYRIEAVAGRGGMGVVYRAWHLGLERPVALKVISPELASRDEFRARFRRESRLAAALDHPHVLPLYEAGEHDGVLFIAMRWVDGTDLGRLLENEAAEGLAVGRALRLVEQVAGALDASHARGLVHRDVKPANVLLATEGGAEHAYLADFGLAKRDDTGGLTETGRWLGTPDYAAPEQIDGGDVGAPADVYALGCVLYAAVTGRPPFERAMAVAVAYAQIHDAPPRPSAARPELPAGLDAVVARALAKRPEERYGSAGELAAAARAAVAGKPARRAPRRAWTLAPSGVRGGPEDLRALGGERAGGAIAPGGEERAGEAIAPPSDRAPVGEGASPRGSGPPSGDERAGSQAPADDRTLATRALGPDPDDRTLATRALPADADRDELAPESLRDRDASRARRRRPDDDRTLGTRPRRDGGASGAGHRRRPPPPRRRRRGRVVAGMLASLVLLAAAAAAVGVATGRLALPDSLRTAVGEAKATQPQGSGPTVRCNAVTCRQGQAIVAPPREGARCDRGRRSGTWTRIEASGNPMVACVLDAADPPLVAVHPTVPDLVGARLDLAERVLDRQGIPWDLDGGGLLGVVVPNNWTVCSTDPPAGDTVPTDLPVTLSIDHDC
jgi:Protein kinase domain